MKKLIITMLALSFGAIFIHAQGLVSVSGRPNPSPGIVTNTSSLYFPQAPGTPGVVSGPVFSQSVGGVAYIYALLIAPVVTSADSSPLGPDWSQATIYGSSGTFITATNHPIISGGANGFGNAGGVAINGWTPGTSMNVMLVGWSANLGDSWAAIKPQFQDASWNVNGFFGYSAIANIISGGDGMPPSPANTIFGGSGIQAFDLYEVIPEPTTVTLAGLGGLSMLFLRRRKV